MLKSESRQDHGRVSADGHRIGRNEIFVQSFPPSGGKWQISNTGGNEPFWRRDGKELYFISGSKLKAVEVNVSGANFEAGIPKDKCSSTLDPPQPLCGNARRAALPVRDGPETRRHGALRGGAKLAIRLKALTLIAGPKARTRDVNNS